MSDEKKVVLRVPSADPNDASAADEREKQRLRDLQEKEEKQNTENVDEEDVDDELSNEDRELKANVELLVERLTEPNSTAELRAEALRQLSETIRTSTSSMTAVPKPLKFLRPHFDRVKAFHTTVSAETAREFRAAHASLISVLALTMAKENSRECLQFALESRTLGSAQPLSFWGHEYVRTLAGEIGQEWAARTQDNKPTEDLGRLVDEIVPFNMEHNAETDAVDLLLEVGRLPQVERFVTPESYARVCQYVLACSDYASEVKDAQAQQRVVFNCYLRAKRPQDAVRVALKLDDVELVQRALEAAADDPLLQRQLGFIMSVQRVPPPEFVKDEELREIIGNVKLSGYFRHVSQELDVVEAKHPEDVYKSHLADTGNPMKRKQPAPDAAQPNRAVESTKQNLASSFVNGFLNMGFGKDKLMLENSEWLYKNKDHGMLVAAASVGSIFAWDPDTGLSSIDKYSFANQDFVKAGSMLATGIVSAGVMSDMEPSFALLSDHLGGNDSVNVRVASVFGLGLAYAGTARDSVMEAILPVLVSGENMSMELVAACYLSLGLIYAGTCHDGLSTTLVEGIMERNAQLDDPAARLMCLGLGLLYLGKGEACEAILEVVQTVQHNIRQSLALIIETCAYAGTGNVLKVQKMLALCNEHVEEEAKNQHQAIAVLGLALIPLGEELGSQMILRSFEHLLQYGEVNIRRAVPIALGLLSTSNPQLPVLDTLSKLSHDQDQEVSQNACLAMGFVGAGTNNARLGNTLRQLAVYYAKEPDHLFLVRLAQGLLHMSKGLVTLSPLHSDGQLLSKTSLAGLLVATFAALDAKNTLLSKKPYLLFAVHCAARPRVLLTVDEKLNPIAVKVRVGQALDTVGQAGKPKRITGFQTHSTPVLLSRGERAELATEEYLPLTTVLEGIVILRKNPDYVPEQ
jgi:26S proteasome regulatory subunit N1